MAAGANVVAKAWVQIIPEMSGIQGEITKEVSKEMAGVEQTTSKAGKSAGSGFSTGFKAAVATLGGIVASVGISDLVQQSAEAQSQMSRLSASAQQNSVSADAMKATYSGLVGVLGDTDRAVETSGNMFALCGDNQEQLQSLTTSLTGAFSQFGDGMPIEALAEAANETAKVGTVTGSMADALNWANASTEQWNQALSGNQAAQAAFNDAIASGASKEDAFNAALAACSSEAERQQLVVDTLNGLYGEAGAAYMNANGQLIAYNQSQDALSSAMSNLGGALMPLKTEFNNFAAELMNGVVPALQMMASGDVKGGVDLLVQTLTNAATRMMEALPYIIQAATGIVSGIILAIGEFLGNEENVLMIVNGFISLFTAFVNVLPTIIEAIATAIPQIVTGIVGVLTNEECILNMVNAFVQLFLALVQALPLIIEALVPLIPTIVTAVGQALVDYGPQLLEAAILLFMTLVDALGQVGLELLASLGQLLLDVLEDIGQWAVDMYDDAAYAASEFLRGVTEWLSQLPTEVGNWLSNVINDVASWASDMADKAYNAGSEFVSNVGNFISGLPGSVAGWLSEMVSNAASFASDLASRAADAGQGFLDGARDGMDQAVSAVSEIPGKITEFFSGARDWLVNSGKSLLYGLIDGIWDGFEAAYDAVAQGLEWLRDLFPFSPAKEGPFSGRGYTTYSGQALMDDWGKAMESAAPSAVASAEEAVGMVRDALSSAMQWSPAVAAAGYSTTAASVQAAAPVTVTGNTFYVRDDSDIEKVARELYTLAMRKQRGW